MAIIKWRPFSDIDKFFDQISHLSKEINQDLAVDLYEKGSDIIIEMNVAGIKSQDLDITIEDDYVKVLGKKEETHEEKDRQYFKKEIRRGEFERIIDLPTAVEVDKAKAEVKDGTLIITLPKSNKKSSRKIKLSQ